MGLYNIWRFKKAATRSDRGASFVEYSLLVTFLAIGSIMAFGAVGQAAGGSFEQVAESFDTPVVEGVQNSDDDAQNGDDDAQNGDDDAQNGDDEDDEAQNGDDDAQNGDDDAQNGDDDESGQSGDGQNGDGQSDQGDGDNGDGQNGDGDN